MRHCARVGDTCSQPLPAVRPAESSTTYGPKGPPSRSVTPFTSPNLASRRSTPAWFTANVEALALPANASIATTQPDIKATNLMGPPSRWTQEPRFMNVAGLSDLA